MVDALLSEGRRGVDGSGRSASVLTSTTPRLAPRARARRSTLRPRPDPSQAKGRPQASCTRRQPHAWTHMILPELILSGSEQRVSPSLPVGSSAETSSLSGLSARGASGRATSCRAASPND
jgi:hypothetical protein